MITASHNPHWDNGMKFFGPSGCKLDDQMQAKLEHMVRSEEAELANPRTGRLGRAKRVDIAHARYVEAVKQTIPRDLRLTGLKIVLDCANGAAYRCAPDILWELGADLIVIGDQPDGTNINRDCGATATAALRAKVISEGADIGIALDGDGDRVIICDEKGQEVDGDQILCLIAERFQKEGRLKGNRVAATIMSNLGLEDHLADYGVGVVRTPVGDRQLAQKMHQED